MTLQLSIEFVGGRPLKIEDGTKWKEAAIIFSHALTTYLPSYLPPPWNQEENLIEHFEGQRPNGKMSTGYPQVTITLLASCRLEIKFDEVEEKITSLFHSINQKFLPILVATSIIYASTKLQFTIVSDGQSPISKEADISSLFAKEPDEK